MTTASELNEDTAKKRQTAANKSRAVSAHETARKRTEYLLELIEEKGMEMVRIDKERDGLDEEMDALKARKKGLNDRAKAIYEDLEAEGVDRKAFQDVHAQAARTERERVKYEASRKLCWSGRGLETGDQIDFVRQLEAEQMQQESEPETAH